MAVLLLDDHALFRAGLRAMLTDSGLFEQFLEASDCAAALRILGHHPEIELVLADIDLPGMSGLEGLGEMRRSYPTVPVVMLSALEDRALVQQAIDAGAQGFVLKSASRELLVSALNLVQAGGISIPGTATTATPALTDRQRQVLRLVAAGRTNRQIAQALTIAENTVRVHVADILRALGAVNRTEAVHRARQLGTKLTS
jgi:DNA-binding NarL/FixJ family response regulator